MRRRAKLQRAFQAEYQRAAGYGVVHNHQCPGSESFENHGDASAFRSIPIRVRPFQLAEERGVRDQDLIAAGSISSRFGKTSKAPEYNRLSPVGHFRLVRMAVLLRDYATANRTMLSYPHKYRRFLWSDSCSPRKLSPFRPPWQTATLMALWPIQYSPM